MNTPKLFMLLLGCRPKGRFTEQHDVFFGIGHSLRELLPHIHASWPEAKSTLHIDAWREVTSVEGYRVQALAKESAAPAGPKLFFINLGGYRPGEFDEYHCKLLTVAGDKEAAIKAAKQSLFYKHTGFKGAAAHVDDTYGLDVDEVYEINDLLAPVFKAGYRLHILPGESAPDALHLGYLPPWKIRD